MSASMLVLDLIRSHYRGDAQAFRAFALRLARMTNNVETRQTMLDVLDRARDHAPTSRWNGNGGASPTSSPRPATPPRQPASQSRLMEPLAEVSLDDLLLEDYVRMELDDLVLELAHRSELAEHGLAPRCRLLFEGPPGNGKTSAACGIALELGLPAYGVSVPSLVSEFCGKTSQNLGELFEHVDQGMLVVFDELDAIGSERMSAHTGAATDHNTTVSTILTLLDRKTVGALVATTNRADIMDPAVLRRFDDIVTFPAPSSAQMELLSRRLEKKFHIGPVNLVGCENFDAVTKRVLREARRVVMGHILAAKAASTEELADDESAQPDAEE
jgi:SpoVK/Ycf46/Vps4 family AAA+-type ATPase